jgi:microcystin-dependent protein
MGQPYVGEIRIFAGNFAPAGWHFCDGSVLPISENDVLFQLIGTTYGGDGEENFALPNLNGRVPIHSGKGPEISQTYIIGEAAGTETVVLAVQQLPNHTHPMIGSTNTSAAANPTGNVVGKSTSVDAFINAVPGTPLNATAILPVGGSQPHENMQPFLVVSYIISLFGLFPSQN